MGHQSTNQMVGTLDLKSSNCSTHTFSHHHSMTEHVAEHVLIMVALDHLIGMFKAGIGDLQHLQQFMVGLLS